MDSIHQYPLVDLKVVALKKKIRINSVNKKIAKKKNEIQEVQAATLRPQHGPIKIRNKSRYKMVMDERLC